MKKAAALAVIEEDLDTCWRIGETKKDKVLRIARKSLIKDNLRSIYSLMFIKMNLDTEQYIGRGQENKGDSDFPCIVWLIYPL